MHDLLVVGGGPSGVAAAAYGQHLGMDTAIISPDLGGKVNYRFSIPGLENVETVHGASLVQTFAALISPDRHFSYMVQAIEAVPSGFRVSHTADEWIEGRALVVATGVKPRRLYVPGEEELWGRGLSYSATSHAPLFVGKEVAVIGSERRAQVAALELARVAHRVTFIIPQPHRLEAALLERLSERGNVHLFQGWEVVAIMGRRFVRGLTLQSMRGVTREISLDGVFMELGLIPNSDLLVDLVERDEKGFIKIDQNNRTSRPGLFAAGDVSNIHGEQVPVALGEGIKAAISASEYIVSL